MASTMDVARKLVELCRQGRNLEAIDTLYDKDIVSIETMSMPNMPARMQGIAAIRGKNQWWMDNHEVHDGQISDPFPHGERFIILMTYDVTAKAGPMAGKRLRMQEAGLYTVRNGKIAQEEFFYEMEG